MNHFARYLKKEKGNIKMTSKKPKEMQFVGVVDSSFATDKNSRKSVSGAIYTIGKCIVRWTSKSQKSTALLSTEAEYYVLSLAS